MPELVNMKISKAEREKRMEPTSIASDAPTYPWGLSLSLDNESLDKLGMSTLPSVGDEMTVVATVKVTSVSSNESDTGKNKSVSLQITDMLVTDLGDAKDAARALYSE